MGSKNRRPVTRKKGVSYLNVIRKITSGFYTFMESFFKPDWITRIRIKRGKLDIPLDIAKMNRLMQRFYKRPNLKISSSVGLEEVKFKSIDGLDISAIKYKCNPDSNKWVVACHWFGGHKYWPLYNSIMFRKMGYNVLSIDFRSHGKSQKDVTSMGAKEVWDLMGAIEYISQEEKPEHIALYGISMGAFCVSYLSVYDPEFCKKHNIKFGVCDSAYESLYSLYTHVRNIYLRIIPKRRTQDSVVKFMQHDNRADSNREINYFSAGVLSKIKLEKKVPAYPILFMHAQNDKVTSPIDSYKVFAERCKLIDGDEIWTFRYGTHALMTKEHFKQVERRIGSFIADKNNDKELYIQAANDLKLFIKEKRDERDDKTI